MKQIDAHALLETHVKPLWKYFVRIQGNYTPEGIHSYRVEMKKLRALLRLLNTGKQGKRLKFTNDIKNYNQILGQIRNLQLQQKRISGLSADLLMPVPEEYSAYLQMKLEGLYEEAKDISKNVSFHKLRQKTIQRAQSKIDVSEVESVLALSKLHLIQLISLKSHSDDDIHAFRKELKNFFYTATFFLSGHAFSRLIIDIDKVKHLTDQLGDFHDLCISIQLLSPADISVINNPDERQVLQFFNDHLKWSKTHLKNAIIHHLTNLKNELGMNIPAITFKTIPNESLVL